MEPYVTSFIAWLAPIVSTLITAYATSLIATGEKKRDEARKEIEAKRAAEAEWMTAIESRMDSQDQKIEAVLKGQTTQMRSDLIHRAHRYVDDLGCASTEEKEAFWAEYEDYVHICTAHDVVNNFIESTEWCNVCARYGVRSGAVSHKAEFASDPAIGFATRLYTRCLNRDPEQDGLNYWSLALTNLEKTGCQAAREFFESEEFQNFHTSDEEYVLRLYQTFMDRIPEPGEFAYWCDKLRTGGWSRRSVMEFFGQSPEFTNVCASYGIERGTI